MKPYPLAALLALTVLSGCATTTTTPSRVDPLEPLNRAAFRFNEPIDRDIVIPVVRAYEQNVPAPVRTTVRNFFNNIEDFFSGVNGLLQNKPDKAGHDFGRVIVNSFFGIGGLIDVASEAGIPRGEEDFGQTLGVWGVPNVPYLFIPLFGPTTARDGTGFALRAVLSPIDYIPSWEAQTVLWSVAYVEARSQALEAQTLAGQASLDPYTFIRRSYLQRREYLTYDGKPPPAKEED